MSESPLYQVGTLNKIPIAICGILFLYLSHTNSRSLTLSLSLTSFSSFTFTLPNPTRWSHSPLLIHLSTLPYPSRSPLSFHLSTLPYRIRWGRSTRSRSRSAASSSSPFLSPCCLSFSQSLSHSHSFTLSHSSISTNKTDGASFPPSPPGPLSPCSALEATFWQISSRPPYQVGALNKIPIAIRGILFFPDQPSSPLVFIVQRLSICPTDRS